jgi:hypothetical protein
MSEHLDQIKGTAQRMAAQWPETRPGLDIIVGHAAIMARALQRAHIRIQELEGAGQPGEPVVVRFGSVSVAVGEPEE